LKLLSDSDLSTCLERFMEERGAFFLACADLRFLPETNRKGLPFGVCIGVELNPSIVAGITAGPTREYAAEYERANKLLQSLGDDCADFLRKRGYKAAACLPSVDKLDYKTLSTALPHKTVATRAGIGWIGKCALLVTKTHGSAIRYNTVLTDAPLRLGTPVEVSYCEDCSFCVEACPAGAPSGRDWSPGLERGNFFDAFACCEKAGQLAGEIGIKHTICGICIAACPFTKRYLKGRNR
jgi:epoxyqueuosine reductase